MPLFVTKKRGKIQTVHIICAVESYSNFDSLSKATGGVKTRSLCSLVCKWTYRGQSDEKGQRGWDRSYFSQIGLDENANFYEKIGQVVANPGEKISSLGNQAAMELGLSSDVIVACGLIDAHSGVLGLLATRHINVESTLALISGTSACHMILNKEKMMISGIWGPYFGAILQEYWLHEGGQSSVGSLIDHLVKGHPAWPQIKDKGFGYLEEICQNLAVSYNRCPKYK